MQGVTNARLAAFTILKTLNFELIDEDVLEANKQKKAKWIFRLRIVMH